MQVNQVDIRPAPDALYTVAGRLLFTQSFNHQLRNLIGFLFAGWQLTPVSLTDRTPDIRISFFCGDRQPDIPDNLNQFEIAGGGQCYTGTGELYVALQDSLLRLKETKPLSVDVWFAE